MLRFEVHCETAAGQYVAVTGSGPQLGNWDMQRCVVLDPSAYPLWCREVPVRFGDELEYKYILVSPPADDNGKRIQVVSWESLPQVRRACMQRSLQLMLRDFYGKLDGSTVTRVEEETPSLLENMDVDPSVRLCRVQRAGSSDVFEMKYDIDYRKVLGTGMSGGVCVATRRDDGGTVAVKTLSTRGLSEQMVEQTLKEVRNQLSMDHPNICRLLEVIEEPERLLLVMEHMRGPDLYEHFARKGCYSEQDAAFYVRQMVAAVHYCHGRRVCHRDLKLENFCLEDDSPDARLKLIDFGLSETFTSLPMIGAVGTVLYVAPEVLQGSYNEKCDMWSLGVITYVLLDGSAPFRGKDDASTARLVSRGHYTFSEGRWKNISEAAREFVSALLQVDPATRLSGEETLNHPWLANAGSADVQAGAAALEADVLLGMRNFALSSALRRAVLAAVAPAATVQEVARWADQFEALDEQKTGLVSAQDLTARLKEYVGSEMEAASLSNALAGLDGRGEEISYTAFLAACLAAHSQLNDTHLACIFQRLDTDADGLVLAADLQQALGDVWESRELPCAPDQKLTFNDFRWLVHAPCSMQGLRNRMSSWESWRASTKNCRKLDVDRGGRPDGLKDDEEFVEAKRQENLIWRRTGMKGGMIDATIIDKHAAPAAVGDADTCDAMTDEIVANRRKENLYWRRQAKENILGAAPEGVTSLDAARGRSVDLSPPADAEGLAAVV